MVHCLFAFTSDRCIHSYAGLWTGLDNITVSIPPKRRGDLSNPLQVHLYRHKAAAEAETPSESFVTHHMLRLKLSLKGHPFSTQLVEYLSTETMVFFTSMLRSEFHGTSRGKVSSAIAAKLTDV